MGTKGSQGPPPWGGSSGDRGGGEDAALPTAALTPSPRTGLPSAGELTSASFWHLRRCSPSGCWEALDWMTRGYCGERRHHPLRRSCCHRCCHSHSGRDRHRGRDGPLRPLPGAALRCGGAARARSCAEGNRPAPAGEGRRGGRGRAARRRAEGPVSRARLVLNGLGGRIVRPRRRGVGTEKGGWKAETFL